MARIFISYRRDDAAGYSHLVFDRLARTFGRRNVFMDVDALEPGVDFVDGLERAVSTCDTVVALIGKRWLDITDDQGQQRIGLPDDYVQLEIATAFKHDVRVLPVLVRGAAMPASADLPDAIKPLGRRNAIALSDERIDYDLKRLINVLLRASATESWLDRFEVQSIDASAEVLGAGPKLAPSPRSPRRKPRGCSSNRR